MQKLLDSLWAKIDPVSDAGVGKPSASIQINLRSLDERIMALCRYRGHPTIGLEPERTHAHNEMGACRRSALQGVVCAGTG